MDKAEIRATDSRKIIESTGWYGKIRVAFDDALVEAYQQGHREGWNAGVEAEEAVEAIRRLKKGQGVTNKKEES